MKRIALRIKAAATLMTVGAVLVTQIFPLQAFAEDIASPPAESVPVISAIDAPSSVPVVDSLAPIDGSFLLPAVTTSEPSDSVAVVAPVVVSESVTQTVVSDAGAPSVAVETAAVAPAALEAVSDEAVVPEEEVDDEVVDTANESDIDLYKNFEGVVRQSTPVTCGPASLATLFSQLGDSTTEADVLQYVQVDAERGVNMLQLKTASEKLNHPAVLKHWSVDQLTAYLAENADPILIHDVKEGVGGHFSVLREVVDGKVTLSDTEAGNITYSLADFAHVYDGYVLIADPDASIAAIADEATNLSDADAANIWGKYVPVALAASRNGASDAASAFKWCMERALTLSSATVRNNERKGCYIQLGQALAVLAQTSGGLWKDTKIAWEAGGDEKNGDPANAQYSMGSNYNALVDARNAARAAAARANEQYQLDLAKPNPISDSNNVILGKKADLERQLEAKSGALRAANDQVAKAQFDLGNVKLQISASTSNLASLSRSFQNKLADLNARLTSKQSKLRFYIQERDSWSGLSTIYQNKINSLSTTRLARVLNSLQIGILIGKKIYADGLCELNKIFAYRAQNEVNDLEQQIRSGGGTSAEEAIIAGLIEKQQTIEDDIARKQKRIPGIQDEINTINTAIAKLPALKTVPPPASKAAYDAAVLAYANAVQAVADEKAFIDAQEGQLDSALTNFVLNGAVNSVMQAPFVRGFGDQVVAFSQLGKDGPIVAAKNIVVGTGDFAVKFVVDVYLTNNLQDQITQAITVYENLSPAEQSSVRQYVYGGMTFQLALVAVTHGTFKAVSGIADALVDQSAIESTVAPVAVSAELDSEYVAYVARKTRAGSVPRTRADWEVVRNYFLNNVKIARGNDFNLFRKPQYQFNEITLENGKRLDSYRLPVKAEDGTVIKPGEIVSRKATDLGDIQLSTFKKYLSELKNKYQPGMKVVAGDDSRNFELVGRELEGVQILEIPDSNLLLPDIEEYRSIARDNYGIKLRFVSEK